MKHAIEELKRSLETARNNGPIHRQEGNTAQADLCAETAFNIERAVQVLEGIASGKIAVVDMDDYPKGSVMIGNDLLEFLAERATLEVNRARAGLIIGDNASEQLAAKWAIALGKANQLLFY